MSMEGREYSALSDGFSESFVSFLGCRLEKRLSKSHARDDPSTPYLPSILTTGVGMHDEI